ncbi:GTP cyclohydrolase II [Microbulbifer flavimaris]|uniref:GTP cyclohydrolase-2 n=1 Tax=Microbulbifer flavimaris TaxID=1781068 RepID=A0ABX4HZX5_9GAMM|nr:MULTISPECIES: GTP cyclohydrolase II [Microbulbifer]PCO05684.1 GTP cyclohydrolase II [Microbulbifer flavimaris]
MTIRFVESSKLPTPWGMFEMHGFEETETGKEHVVLTMGDMDTDEPLLARIHSECLTGDALFSLRCDCGAQLQHAMHRIAMEGRGAIFYLRQEGRGIGLLNKIRAYHLQDCGADTVEANEQLGFGADMRDYSILREMLKHLGAKSIRLMTNNPRKVKALEELGIEVTERLPHETGRNPHNVKYLSTKKGKLGHLFEDEDEAGKKE